MSDDRADRHVQRWRNHWIDVPFDDEVEAAAVRLHWIAERLTAYKEEAAARVGLELAEYATLHTLMIRDTPGRASPTRLAEDLGISPAGMTGRLAKLERAGYVQRVPSEADRRRLDVEVTRAGAAIWREAMDLRGRREDDMADALNRKELVTLNRMLKRMLARLDRDADPPVDPK
ncbi:MarR family winged helix-turn-helix transcriptional regulator [Microlunatus speluncae]|uniref:MarR family winged helix-turn-helix transcriptional regulator n=1 Tax=Microlunatus speluncae TaxID=2594267 RepID=UPI0012667858|nr:MarR family transcriptional regulator [Microlunatus speluncae]